MNTIKNIEVLSMKNDIQILQFKAESNDFQQIY